MLDEIMLSNSREPPPLDVVKSKLSIARGSESNRRSGGAEDDAVGQQEIEIVRWDDVHVGKMLGSGSFNAVFDVRLKEVIRLPWVNQRCKQTSNVTEDSAATTSTAAFSDWSGFATDGCGKFAIKCVSDQTFENRQAQDAAEGLRNEAKILLSLPRHNHIIEMVAMSPDFDLTCLEPASLDSFLIMNQLSMTLDQYILRVKARLTKQSPCLTGGLQHFLPSVDKKRSIRVGTIGLSVARALEFLHRHNIIYRDLKPSNIGFDAQHNVRLFDFGLSTVAPHQSSKTGPTCGDQSDEATHYLTTFVGTPLYMAPEVRGNPFYDFRVDVYSFGFLLRELYTLEPPPIRRSLLWQPQQGIANSKIRNLVRDCTRLDRCRRPSMSTIVTKVDEWNHLAIP